MEYNLNPDVEVTPFSLEPEAKTSVPLSPSVAAQRAIKAKLGMPQLPQSVEEVQQMFQSGQEDVLRKAAAADADYNKNAQRLDAIGKIMVKLQRPLTPAEEEQVGAMLSDRKRTDPASVFEEFYPIEYMNTVKRTGDLSGWMQEAKQKMPSYVDRMFYGATDYGSKVEYLKTIAEDMEAKAKSQSWFGWGVDRAKEFLIPFYWNYKLRQDDIFTQGFLLGENLENQSKEAFQLPFDQFKSWAKTKAEALSSDNPALAVQWAQAMIGQSTSEKGMNDIFSTLDLPIIGSVAKLGVKGVQAARLAKFSRDAAQTAAEYVSKMEPGKATMQEAAGNIREGGAIRVIEEVAGSMKGYPPNPVSVAARNLPGMFTDAIEGMRANPGRLSTDVVNKIVQRISNTMDEFTAAVTKGIKIDRLPGVMAVDRVVKGITETLRRDNPLIDNNILNIKLRHDPETNLFYVDYYLGKNGIELWDSKNVAQQWLADHNFAKEGELFTRNKTVISSTGQQGVKFYARVSRPLREIDDVVRDGLLPAEYEALKTPDSWLNSFGGWLGSKRTPEETLSLENRMARKIATYGPSWLLKVAQDSAKELTSFRRWALPFTKQKQKWEEWNRVTKANLADRDTQGAPRFYNPNQLDHAYQTTVGRLPDEQEIAAYYAWQRSHMMDHALRNLEAYKELHRMGAQKWTVFTLDPAMVNKQGNTLSKGWSFNGIKRNKMFPANGESVLFIGDEAGEELVRDSSKIKGAVYNRYKEDLEQGKATLIEVAKPSEHPFDNYSEKTRGARIKYVYTKHPVNEENLDWVQLPRRAVDYDYDHFAKQAIIRQDPITGKFWYNGDRTIAGLPIREMTKDVVNKLNVVRELIRDGKIDEAKLFADRNPIGHDFEDIHRWFRPDITTEGLPIPAKLDLNTPIHYVPRGKSTFVEYQREFELDFGRRGKELKDGTKDGYGRYFSKEANAYDIFSLENEGTMHNPLYKAAPVATLDPVTAINRALNRTINDLFLNDYKIASVEHWLAEAGPLLNASKEDLRSAPFYHFFNTKFRSLSGDAVSKINNLETARFQIKQFLGVQNETDSWLHAAAQKLSDTIYAKGLTKTALLPAKTLPLTRDPTGFVRSMVFHSKLGMFNPAQLWIQAQTFITIAGIAGSKFALPGAKAVLLHSWAALNESPEILAKLDKYASTKLLPGTFSFKPGWFLEARELLKRTGLQYVAGEHAQLDMPTANHIIPDAKKSFLDLGKAFFTAGEKSVRLGAWYTAYLEFRGANPTVKIGQKELTKILERADLLYVNMSRASSSTLHSGILSIPTQFLAYQLRVAELFLGKRLTQTERIRLFGTYGLMYGFPTAFGVTGFPMGDYIRKWAQENGYVAGDSYLNSALTEGIPSMMIALATMEGSDLKTGKFYNIGERYGTQGIEVFRDLFRSDKTWWETLGGPSGQTIANSIANLDGFSKMVTMGIRGDGIFKPKIEDFLDPFNEITSVSSARRLIAALNTQQWLSRKEAYLSDVSKGDAIFRTLTGLDSQANSDVHTMLWTRQQEKEMQKAGLDYFVREFRRGMREAKDNPGQGEDYFKRAFAGLRLSNYPDEKMSEAISIATKGYESMLDRVTWEYLTRDVQENRKEIARKVLPLYLNRNRSQ